MTTNEKGNLAVGQAIAYFTKEQYTVNIPLNDTQWYDLIVEKNGIFYTVQVKYSGEKTEYGTYKCSVKTTSGTTRQKSYSLIEKPVDLLFVYCANNFKYLIPVKEIKNTHSITLHTQDGCNNGFNTYKYIIND